MDITEDHIDVAIDVIDQAVDNFEKAIFSLPKGYLGYINHCEYNTISEMVVALDYESDIVCSFPVRDCHSQEAIYNHFMAIYEKEKAEKEAKEKKSKDQERRAELAMLKKLKKKYPDQ